MQPHPTTDYRYPSFPSTATREDTTTNFFLHSTPLFSNKRCLLAPTSSFHGRTLPCTCAFSRGLRHRESIPVIYPLRRNLYFIYLTSCLRSLSKLKAVSGPKQGSHSRDTRQRRCARAKGTPRNEFQQGPARWPLSSSVHETPTAGSSFFYDRKILHTTHSLQLLNKHALGQPDARNVNRPV